ncbi:MAG: hypothetical protein K6G22_13810 [Lachnospiraceae bacterium]|nr:hypothetical protein [Lachnospiraceae bacterium]
MKKRIRIIAVAVSVFLPLVFSKITASKVFCSEQVFYRTGRFTNISLPAGCDSLSFKIHRGKEGDVEYTCPYCNGLYAYTSIVRGYIPPGTASLTVRDETTGCESVYDSDAGIVLDPTHQYTVTVTSQQGYAEEKCMGDGTATGRGCGYGRTYLSEISTELTGYGTTGPQIISQPQSVSAVTDGSASFTVEAVNAASYRWQIASGGSYADLNDGTVQGGCVFSGTASKTLSIVGLRTSLNGTGYRCVVTGGNGATIESSQASLTVNDATPPVISVSADKDGYTAGSVTYTVAADDADSGLPDKPYSYDGGNTWTSSNRYEQAGNGSIHVAVRDAAGNTARQEITTSNIDRQPPAVSVSKNPASEKAANVVVSISASDTGSGLPDEPYYYNGSWHKESSFTVSKNGTYAIKVRDRAGNICETDCTVSNIKDTQTSQPSGGNGGGNSGGNGNAGSQQNNGGPGGTTTTSPTTSPAVSPTVTVSKDPVIAITPEIKNDTQGKGTSGSKDKKEQTDEEDTVSTEESNISEDEGGYMIHTSIIDEAGPKEEESHEQAVLSVKKPPVVIGDGTETERKKGLSPLELALLIAGGLLLLALLLFILFFSVIFLYEKEEDEKGSKKYGIAGISLLYYKEDSWTCRVSSQVYDMCPLKVVFGIVFVTLLEGAYVKAVIKDENRYRSFVKKLLVSRETVLN